jgi:hypothetical protein
MGGFGIPDPGVKKAPDAVSGFATLSICNNRIQDTIHAIEYLPVVPNPPLGIACKACCPATVTISEAKKGKILILVRLSSELLRIEFGLAMTGLIWTRDPKKGGLF